MCTSNVNCNALAAHLDNAPVSLAKSARAEKIKLGLAIASARRDMADGIVRRNARKGLVRGVLGFLAVAVWVVCAEQIARADDSQGPTDMREIATFTAGHGHAVLPAPAATHGAVQVCNGDMSVCAPVKALVGAPVSVKH